MSVSNPIATRRNLRSNNPNSSDPFYMLRDTRKNDFKQDPSIEEMKEDILRI